MPKHMYQVNSSSEVCIVARLRTFAHVLAINPLNAKIVAANFSCIYILRARAYPELQMLYIYYVHQRVL